MNYNKNTRWIFSVSISTVKFVLFAVWLLFSIKTCTIKLEWLDNIFYKILAKYNNQFGELEILQKYFIPFWVAVYKLPFIWPIKSSFTEGFPFNQYKRLPKLEKKLENFEGNFKIIHGN